MKKKLVLSLAAAALVGTLAVGGTLAWFTDTETATNVVTTGHVDISVMEKAKDDPEVEYGVQDNAGLILDGKYVPGATVDKVVAVRNNTGSNQAWIRVKVEMPNSMAEAKLVGVDDTKWVQSGEYYYYTSSVSVGKTTDPLFTGVKLPDTWGNEMTDQGTEAGLEIKVTAEAVQADERAEGTSYLTAFDNVDVEHYETEAESVPAPSLPEPTVPETPGSEE